MVDPLNVNRLNRRTTEIPFPFINYFFYLLIYFYTFFHKERTSKARGVGGGGGGGGGADAPVAPPWLRACTYTYTYTYISSCHKAHKALTFSFHPLRFAARVLTLAHWLPPSCFPFVYFLNELCTYQCLYTVCETSRHDKANVLPLK